MRMERKSPFARYLPVTMLVVMSVGIGAWHNAQTRRGKPDLATGAVRGAIAGLMAEVVEDHVRTHLVDARQFPGALNAEATEQLLAVVKTYLK